MRVDPDPTSPANRVGACAVGLAFAERADTEALRELVDMADGRRSLLLRARARVGDLGTLDECVLRRADRLLEAAARLVPPANEAAGNGPGSLVAGG
jgi:hypothetical protein